MQRKRIFLNTQNDTSPDFFISPCLEINPNAQLKETPTNGEEYLLQVMTERRNCPAVTKCQQDYSMLARNQTYFIKESPHNSLGPDKLKPSIEWQNKQVADFSESRMYVSRLRANSSLWPKGVKKMWLNYRSDDGWKLYFKSKDPTLSSFMGMHPSLLDRGLEILIEHLEELQEDTIDDKTGQWIYSLLTGLTLPLLSDTISILRDLARKCIEMRARVNPEDDNAMETVVSMNIFICLVGRYFRQYDLAD